MKRVADILGGMPIPLPTVQRLLTIKLNVPLRNVEMLMEALGLNIQIIASGKSVVRPGTGRGHGQRRGSNR
jgi:hypothetical protein